MNLSLSTRVRPLVTASSQWGRWRRAMITFTYLVLLTIGLVQSSAHPLLGPSAPEDFNLLWEVLLTAGHLVGFGLLVLLIWWLLVVQAPPLWALVVAVVFAATLGLVTELLQGLVPDRSASLFDLVCDWGVATAVAYVIYRRIKRGMSTPNPLEK
ncbi:MAG: VanZ family protein [Anaerolineae bacterium]